ncbi:hypothetical protein BJ165DRAFT_1611116 [Panaeolus papilionaceus]|nr:hypothetical protein BJ165DRAFT_1611116 [Panaeolus papilionaceus]
MLSTSSNIAERETTVPYDVLELIIDNLASNDTAFEKNQVLNDIQTCCLVSRSWVHLCRSRLFKEVEIGIKATNPNQRKRLAFIISKQPSIGTFIRKITYTRPVDGDEEKGGYDKHFSSFFGLPNVRTLEILSHRPQSYGNVGLHYFGWRSILDNYLSSGQLTSLSIKGLHDLPFLCILSSPLLDNLKLVCGSVSSLHPTATDRGIQIPHSKLTSIEATHVEGLSWPLLANACPCLKSIRYAADSVEADDLHPKPIHLISFPRVTFLSISGVYCNYLGSLGEGAFPEITTLHVYPPFSRATDTTTEGSPLFGGLQTLKFCVNPGQRIEMMSFESFDWDLLWRLVNSSRESLADLHLDIILPGSAHHFLTMLSEILADVKCRNVLESLKLVLDDCSTSFRAALSSQVGWKNLADTLVNERMDFPYLRHVEIEYCIGCELHYYRDEGFQERILEEPLRKLSTCPDMNFQHNTYIEYYS